MESRKGRFHFENTVRCIACLSGSSLSTWISDLGAVEAPATWVTPVRTLLPHQRIAVYLRRRRTGFLTSNPSRGTVEEQGSGGDVAVLDGKPADG